MNKIEARFESARYFQITNLSGPAVFGFLQAHRHLFKTMRVSPVATALILETERLPRFVEYAASKGIEVIHVH